MRRGSINVSQRLECKLTFMDTLVYVFFFLPFIDFLLFWLSCRGMRDVSG
jgi:hypothetical protein